MKSYEITGKSINISIFLIKIWSLIRVFIYLAFRTWILLIYGKKNKQKQKNSFLVIFLKNQF